MSAQCESVQVEYASIKNKIVQVNTQYSSLSV